MKEKWITVELFRYVFDGPNEHAEITFKFVPREHWRTSDPGMKAYDVVGVDGTNHGYIERSVESTDRHYGRIRVPGKGRLAWQYRGEDRSSSPGVHCVNRLHAVARLLGYESARAVS